jgi:hypothetical protein
MRMVVDRLDARDLSCNLRIDAVRRSSGARCADENNKY